MKDAEAEQQTTRHHTRNSLTQYDVFTVTTVRALKTGKVLKSKKGKAIPLTGPEGL
jgi:hypothetical protein